MNMESVRTALYRHFDSAGKLLYVGISLSPTYRLAQHRDEARWFARIGEVKVHWYESRSDALAAERRAIRAESPEFNIQHKTKEDTIADRREEAKEMAAFELIRSVTRYKSTYDIQSAAVVVGCSTTQLRLAIEQGHIPSFPNGKKTIVTGWALIGYIEALESRLVLLPKHPARNKLKLVA